MSDKPQFLIRPAAQREWPEIRRLIYAERLNPLGLDWRRFRVAVDPSGLILGCGQIKPHHDGTYELASIVTCPEMRGQGVASAMIRYLIAENPGRLHLTCRARLGSFYEQFGFRTLPRHGLPPYFRRVKRIADWLRQIFHGEEMLVMGRD